MCKELPECSIVHREERLHPPSEAPNEACIVFLL
jgi:hypothetical protein